MRRHPLFLALLFAALAATPARAQTAPPPPIPTHGTASRAFAPDWSSAFVSGNGQLGAMVLGSNPAANPPRANEETIFLSHAGLFLPVGGKQVVPVLGDSLPALRDTIATRGYDAAVMTAYNAAKNQNFPGITYTDPFLPALELNLKMPLAGTARDYLRTTNFETGEVAIHWTDDNGSYLRKLFVSRADNLAVLSISRDPAGNPAPISCTLSIPPIPNVPVRTFSQNNPDAKPADAAANALIQSTTDLDHNGISLHASYRLGNGSGYDAALRVIPTGGTTETIDGTLAVKDAQSILILLRVKPFKQTTANSDHDLRASLAAIPPNYDDLLAAHKKIHTPLFNRVSLDLNAGTDRQLTTDQLIARANKDATLSPALLERLYDASRYALLSSAGIKPPNMQGIWAAQWAPNPTLAGDYAFDSSLPLSLAPALSSRSPELLLGLFHLADLRRADWQLNAHNLFASRGIFVPAHQSSNGQNLQWSARLPAGLFWTSGAGILAHAYYDYFLYTADRQFLATQALPFMKQVADFYEDFLFLDSTGKYRFSPSFSAEDAAGDNATQEIMVARELLTNLIAAARLLNTDQASIPRWQKMLDQLPPYLIAPSGELQEWALPGVENKPGQRHLPHLYAIHTSHEFDPQLTPDLWNAAHAAYQARLERGFRPLTPSDSPRDAASAQPLADRLTLALCAARFGEGQTVSALLTRIAARNTLPSLMTSRTEERRTFTSDGNAIAQILNSALLDSQPGRIDLLPALPPSLPSGEIRGIAARSTIAPITITRLAWSPTQIQLDLLSPADQPLEIHPPNSPPKSITLKSNHPTHLTFP